MSAALDVAYEIERYAIKHGRLPRAQSPAELSQALLGSDSMVEALVDAWKTPLHIESDPETNTYVVASAGADGAFQRQTWSTRAATRTANDDIVIRNGETVRWPEAWALELFDAAGGDAVESLQGALDASKAARTLADLMTIRTGIEMYVADRGRPPADMSALVPMYLRDVPRTDAWGKPFAIHVDPAAKTYRVVSAGADGTFDESRWSERGDTRDYARDAVLENGELTAAWQTRNPARALGSAYASFVVFKGKHASLRTMSEEERRKLRMEGLLDEIGDAAEANDLPRAIALYEEAEKLDPEFRDTERLLSWALSFTLDVPPPPGQAPAPRPIDDPKQRPAAPRIAAALRRALPHAPVSERWTLTETLANLERERGDADAARAWIATYASAHPGDPRPRLYELDEARKNGDVARALRIVDDIAALQTLEKDALYRAGMAIYDLVAKSGDGIDGARKRALVFRGRDLLSRAAAADPEAMEPLVYLSLLVRQEASLESDPEKSAKLIEEADALRARAIEISRRRRGGS